MKEKLIVENMNYDCLKDISFSIKKNSLVAVTSKNNIEKELLLECLAGLYPYYGDIYIDGNILKKSNKLDNRVGICKGIMTLNYGSSFDNVIEPLINTGVDYNIAKKQVYEIFKKIDIEDLMNKNIKDLSYSQKKMISILKCIILNPSLILIENPFDSLDSNYRNKIIKYFNSLKKSIIIFTTNNAEDLLLADHIMILKNGKIQFLDEKETLFENESAFIKNGIKLPFIIDLSHKLKSYELVNHISYSEKEIIDDIWK